MVANLKLVANANWYEARMAAPGRAIKKNIIDLPINFSLISNAVDEATPSYKMLATVILAHLVILATILTSRPDEQVIEKVMSPMTVSLISNLPQDKPLTMPQQPEVVEIPKKQEQKVKQTRALSEMPATEQAASKAVISEPAELPVVAESAVSETPIKTEQAVHVAEAAAKAEVEPVTEPPKFGAAYLNNPAPTYPSLSRRSGEQGRVLLRVLVSESGLAESVQLDSSSGYEKLDRAAIEAVKKWSFIPAKRSNQPVSAYVLVPVKFSLSSQANS